MSRMQHKVHKKDFPFSLVIVFFVFIYPLVFFPGALFSPKPNIITDSILGQTNEQHVLLPKLLILLVVAALTIAKVRHRWMGHLFGRLLVVYLALVTIGSLMAHDTPTFLLLGPQYRFDGLLYQLGLAAIGMGAFVVLRGLLGVKVLLGAALATGVLQAIVVMLQRAGIDLVGPAVLWGKYVSPAGTIGHHGMVAGLLLPITLIGLGLGSLAKNTLEARLWLIGALGCAAGLGVLQNRSAFFALIVGLILLVAVFRSLSSLIWSGLIATTVLLVPNLIPNNQSFEQSYTQSNTLQTRLRLWQMGFETIKHAGGRIIFGGGPDGFYLSLLRDPPLDSLIGFYRLEHAWPHNTVVEKAEPIQSDKNLRSRLIRVHFKQFGTQTIPFADYQIPDKIHNFILDRWSSYGLIAMLIWLVLYLYPVWQQLRRQVVSPLAVGLVALFIYYLAWFPVMQVEPIHMILVAAAWAIQPHRGIDSDPIVESTPKGS